MDYTITEHSLTITASDAERAWLRDDVRGPVGEYGETTRPYLAIEADALEPIVCNSELEWVRPEEVGALTGAPLIGIVERDDHGEITKVVNVWGFEPYAFRSFVDDLIDDGKARFTNGW